MEKIAIVTRRMITGGIETALVNLLNLFDFDKYDVTLYLLESGGDLFDKIHAKVKVVIVEQIDSNISNMKKIFNFAKRLKIKSACEKFYGDFKAKYKNQVTRQFIIHKFKKYDESYDLAIDFHGPIGVSQGFVIWNLKANCYATFLHIDVYKDGNNVKNFKKTHFSLYKDYDKIFCVSKASMNSFNKLIPEFVNKTDVMYNILNIESILEKSNLGQKFEILDKSIKILSIGRLAEQKGFDIAIYVTEKLLKDGYTLKWYVCGEGGQREYLENLISEKKLQNEFILLGNQLNPFGYLKSCDIYVQSSRSEGYCLTLAEARVLNKPIVTTNFSGAYEQIINNETGLIVECDEQSIYEGVKKLLDSKELKEKLSDNLSKISLNNEDSLNVLYDLLNN